MDDAQPGFETTDQLRRPLQDCGASRREGQSTEDLRIPERWRESSATVHTGQCAFRITPAVTEPVSKPPQYHRPRVGIRIRSARSVRACSTIRFAGSPITDTCRKGTASGSSAGARWIRRCATSMGASCRHPGVWRPGRARAAAGRQRLRLWRGLRPLRPLRPRAVGVPDARSRRRLRRARGAAAPQALSAGRGESEGGGGAHPELSRAAAFRDRCRRAGAEGEGGGRGDRMDEGKPRRRLIVNIPGNLRDRSSSQPCGCT
jgi:hypothetical protein